MRALKGFITAVFILAVVGGVGYGVLAARRQAAARSLENIVVEPAPPQPAAPEEKAALDPRLEGLLARADGARLLWAPEAGERPIAAGFADNGTLFVSATSTAGKEQHWKILRVDVGSAEASAVFDSARPRVVSSHRAAHRNAGTLCYGAPDERGVSEIWCSSLEGKDERRVTTHDGKEDIVAPTISPDGVWVAFEVNDDRLKKPTGASIWKIGLNGANIQQLTRGGDDRKPTWSDDGRKIYFQRRLPGGGWDAYVMDSDGKNPTPLLRTHEEDETYPVRRGATDTFILAEGKPDGTTRIKSLDAVTKAGAYLTSGANGPETSPSISPDGALVSFLAPLSPEEPDRIGL
ncbi:MAG TPA: hypothetical protein VL283_03890, partial [Candidatus Baltobacteraceae bacterium]|nr:hypothetical protein [Candidatus Baltobacteraceae bacterium]